MTESDDRVGRRRVRRLRDVLEPVAACVYFAPEVHRVFQEIGFGPPNPGFAGLEAPNQDAYFTSRGGCMGQVTGEMVTAAFGVFSPDVVVPAVERGWRIASRDDILDARERGTVAFLERALPSSTEELTRAADLLLRGAAAADLAGRPLYAGLRSLGLPGNPAGNLWRAADLVREHRGDCHIAAWTGIGLTPAEVLLLTELWWGIPRRSYALTRGWAPEEYDRADAALVDRGLVSAAGPEGALTEDGLAVRRRVEADTDAMEERVHAAIGDDVDELIGLVEPMAEAIIAAAGYPPQAFHTASDLRA